MACVHEFGILPTVPKPGEEFDDTPQKYNCVTIEDDLLECYGQAINALDCCWNTIDQREKGLAWYGISLLPPATAGQLCKILEQDPNCAEVCEILRRAYAESRFVIHYGV